jgi:hypothetical protein
MPACGNRQWRRLPERLDKVFHLLDVPARGKKCEAVGGFIDEAKDGRRVRSFAGG